MCRCLIFWLVVKHDPMSLKDYGMIAFHCLAGEYFWFACFPLCDVLGYGT